MLLTIFAGMWPSSRASACRLDSFFGLSVGKVNKYNTDYGTMDDADNVDDDGDGCDVLCCARLI